MASGWQYQAHAPTVDRAAYDAGLRAYMLRIFNYMGAGLAITGLVAFMVSQSMGTMQVLFGTPLKWVIMLSPLAFIMVLSFGIHRMSAATAQLVFWAFAAVMGLSMASIFLVFTGASIARVFFITAIMFGSVSLFGYTTKRDLSKMGTFLMMGLIGIVIASIVNIFLGSSMMQFIISVAGVLIFTGLTAWDTQRLKEEYNEGYGHESLGKMAILGALSLYLNFINMFQFLLSLAGDRE